MLTPKEIDKFLEARFRELKAEGISHTTYWDARINNDFEERLEWIEEFITTTIVGGIRSGTITGPQDGLVFFQSIAEMMFLIGTLYGSQFDNLLEA